MIWRKPEYTKAECRHCLSPNELAYLKSVRSEFGGISPAILFGRHFSGALTFVAYFFVLTQKSKQQT